MTEMTITHLAGGNMVALAIASWLYSVGGRDGTSKGIRRYGASAVLAVAVNLTSFFLGNWNPLLLAIYPILVGAFCMGYGDSPWSPKWVKRLIIVAIHCVAGALMCWLWGNWWLLPIQAVIGGCTAMFSFKNPIAAAAEESLVCALNNLIILFYPFIS